MGAQTLEWGEVRADLEAAGVDSTHFGRFVNRVIPGVIEPAPFDNIAATPVLMRWLPRVSDRQLKQAIIRHLRNPAGRGVATDAVLHEFRATADDGVRWVAGDALCYLATPKQRPLLVPLAADARYGSGRQMLFEALSYLKTQESRATVRASLTDPDVALHAGSALRRLVDREEADAILETLTGQDDPRVASAAKRNLKRLRAKQVS